LWPKLLLLLLLLVLLFVGSPPAVVVPTLCVLFSMRTLNFFDFVSIDAPPLGWNL
jgi:hypothetical protein